LTTALEVPTKVLHQSSQNALFFRTVNGPFVSGPRAAAAVGLRHAPAGAVLSLAREKKMGANIPKGNRKNQKYKLSIQEISIDIYRNQEIFNQKQNCLLTEGTLCGINRFALRISSSFLIL
jgi:hypothetical protein